MSLAGTLGRTGAPPTAAAAPDLAATVFDDWAAAEPRWARLVDGPDTLPFQRPAWLRAWYRHHAGPGCRPVVLVLSDPRSGVDLLGLPLVRTRQNGLETISFADGGLTDYNAPALGAATFSPPAPATLWQAVRHALPPADRLVWTKMPERIGERPNPVAALPGARPSRMSGNILHVSGTWEAWLKGLERRFRKEIGRSARVFERTPDALFRRCDPGPEAERIFGDLEALQQARIAELGLLYGLDAEPARSFYRTVVAEGLRDGTAILTALTAGDETVAVLLGVTDGHHYAMVRLATPGAHWKHVSPGRLLIVRTMEMLHREGFRSFDFTIGEYPYKRRLGVTQLPMVEIDRPLSWRGVPASALARLRAEAARRPALRALVRKVRGPAPPDPTSEPVEAG